MVKSHNLKNKFSKLDMKKEFFPQKVLALSFLSVLVLTACQNNLPPERPANTGDRIRVTPVVNNDDALPTLAFTRGTEQGKFLLKNQTARYLNPEKTELEITFSNLTREFCAPAGDLQEGEQELKITVKAKNAISKGELVNADNQISAIYRDKSGQHQFSGTAISTLKVTDLNAAILRGKLKFSDAEQTFEGEYFTAICK